MKIPLLNSFELVIIKKQIRKITNFHSENEIKAFVPPLTSGKFKIYIVTDKKNVLYIGTTRTSLRNRLRSGLRAKGLNGYHGYKWKGLKSVGLFVWCFEESDKDKIENIEAELALLVRLDTGKWPIHQNEIHFNNSFAKTGEIIAGKIYRQLKGELK
jgi:predicted GIY-YIG superfamily endonuclease